jgi:2,4-dienoyl-CoA reductase-like NADH-dependent reductase (Old Yellow Enzyme family)
MTEISKPLAFGHGPAMKNRLLCAPMTTRQSHDDGTLSDEELRWLVMRAEGSFGMVMTCGSHVQPVGRGFFGQLGCWSDDHIPGLARLAAAINAGGSISSLQLYHAGERGEPFLGEKLVAPWDREEKNIRALTTDEVRQAIDDFILAAVRAEKAGFHGIELHGAHGYLPAQFFDKRNQRQDGYGGSYEDRTRFMRETIDGIRAATGTDFQIGLRLSPERRGADMTETLRLAEESMTSGTIDYLDMSLWDCFKEPDEEAFKGRPLISYFVTLPRGDCKLAVAGKMMSAGAVQQCLDAGADFAAIGRAAILHHDFAHQVMSDPSFEAVPIPVPRSYLAKEGVSPAFAVYLSEIWKAGLAD